MPEIKSKKTAARVKIGPADFLKTGVLWQTLTSLALMQEMGFDERKAQRVLKALLDSGLLRRVGRGPATRYEVVRP